MAKSGANDTGVDRIRRDALVAQTAVEFTHMEDVGELGMSVDVLLVVPALGPVEIVSVDTFFRKAMTA